MSTQKTTTDLKHYNFVETRRSTTTTTTSLLETKSIHKEHKQSQPLQ